MAESDLGVARPKRTCSSCELRGRTSERPPFRSMRCEGSQRFFQGSCPQSNHFSPGLTDRPTENKEEEKNNKTELFQEKVVLPDDPGILTIDKSLILQTRPLLFCSHYSLMRRIRTEHSASCQRPAERFFGDLDIVNISG